MSAVSESITTPESVNDNNNYERISYPLDPKNNANPLQLLKSSDWQIKYNIFSNIDSFYSEYAVNKFVMSDCSSDSVILKVQRKVQVPENMYRCEKVKVYNVSDNLQLSQCYKHIVFVRETALMEYYQCYYDPKAHKIYIRQPIYSTTLSTQIKQKTFEPLNDEKAVKFMFSDIFNIVWNIHNCGFIHGDINPNNIVNRQFNDENKFISDGWKLIAFDNIQKDKSDGKYIGSPGWTAPEICIDCISSKHKNKNKHKNKKTKKNKYSFAGDIFSLGLIILFALFGEQPLQITEEIKTKYGQNCDLFMPNNDVNDEKKKLFKQDLKKKMYRNWYYNKLIKSENMIRNYLVGLYYNNKISLALFELLYVGMLTFDAKKRWNCQQIYDCEWFADIRRKDNKKKLRKLRILI